MGMSQEEFNASVLACLCDTQFANRLKTLITDDLVKEVQYLRTVVQKKDAEINQLKDDVARLQQDTDNLEQYTRRNSLRISGIPERAHEDLTDVCLNLFNMRMKLSPKITLNDIDRLHRVGKPEAGKTRAVLVKFATYRARYAVFSARSMLGPRRGARDPAQPWGDATASAANPNAGGTLTAGPSDGAMTGANNDGNVPLSTDENRAFQTGPKTDDIDADTAMKFNARVATMAALFEGTKVYINEDLTRKRASLLYQARVAVKEEVINGCWS